MCDRNENGNVIDPISLEEVPAEFLVTFIQNGIQFCFDLRTLAESFYRTGMDLNPLNREPLPDDVIDQIQSHLDDNIVQFGGRIAGQQFQEAGYLYDDIGQLIIRMYTGGAHNDFNYRTRIGYDRVLYTVYAASTRDILANGDLFDLGLSTRIADIPMFSRDVYVDIQTERASQDTIRRQYEMLGDYARNNIEWLVDNMDLIILIFDHTVEGEMNIHTVHDVDVEEILRSNRSPLTQEEIDTLRNNVVDPYNYEMNSEYYTNPYDVAEILNIDLAQEQVISPDTRPLRTEFDPEIPSERYTLGDLENIANLMSDRIYDQVLRIMLEIRRDWPSVRGFTGDSAYLNMMQDPIEAELFRNEARIRIYNYIRDEYENFSESPPLSDVGTEDEEAPEIEDLSDAENDDTMLSNFLYASSFYTNNELRSIMEEAEDIPQDTLDEYYRLRQFVGSGTQRERQVMYGILLEELGRGVILETPTRRPIAASYTPFDIFPTEQVEEFIRVSSSDIWRRYLLGLSMMTDALLTERGYIGINRYLRAFIDEEFVRSYNTRRYNLATNYAMEVNP